ncbi:hypothetical protein ABFT51_27815 (plasmid) [Paenibacillus peoriae]|uniref:hypothetical protein n=1 Tax=Paenibacillus peoriae TaxID=59893 RepID=UPI0032AF2674
MKKKLRLAVHKTWTGVKWLSRHIWRFITSKSFGQLMANFALVIKFLNGDL